MLPGQTKSYRAKLKNSPAPIPEPIPLTTANDSSNLTQPVGIGVTTLITLVIANMIGAGVFTSSGYSLAALGNPGRVMLAWILCGVWAICGAIAYGSLVARLPESGGEYLFLSRFVHPSVGFLAGWISVIAGFTAPIAAAALGAAMYGRPGLSADAPELTYWAAGLIAATTICHLIGIHVGASMQNLIVGAKLLLIAVLVTWAFGFSSADAWQGGPLAEQAPNWLPDSWSAWSVLVGSMSWIALSYTGFNAAIYVAGESRDARRMVPRAMLWATILVTGIYLALNYVFVYAPTPESIVAQGAIATIAAQAVGGQSLEMLVRVTIVLAMASSVFAMLLAGPRVYQKMADDGVMPSLFKSSQGPPRIATVVQAVLSIVALMLAGLLDLMTYLGLTLSACGALAVASLWWVHLKLPDAPRLHWWERLALALYLGITVCILAASWKEHHGQFIAMLATFGLGVVAYFASQMLREKSNPR